MTNGRNYEHSRGQGVCCLLTGKLFNSTQERSFCVLQFLVFHVGRQDCPDCGDIHTCDFNNGTTDCQGSGVFNASGSGAECYPNGGGYNHSYHDGLGIMSADSLEGPWQSMYLPNDPSLFDTNPAPCKTCRRCFLDLG